MTTKIFRPLKVLSRKHNVAIQVVHHLGKSDKQRMGQRMLGSVANHAWAEDSLYLLRSGKGKVKMELESKVAPGMVWKIENLDNERWDPQISSWAKADENLNSTPRGEGRARRENGGSRQGAIRDSGKLSAAGEALAKLSGIQSTKAIAAEAGLNYQQAYRQLSRDAAVEKHENGWTLK